MSGWNTSHLHVEYAITTGGDQAMGKMTKPYFVAVVNPSTCSSQEWRSTLDVEYLSQNAGTVSRVFQEGVSYWRVVCVCLCVCVCVCVCV